MATTPLWGSARLVQMQAEARVALQRGRAQISNEGENVSEVNGKSFSLNWVLGQSAFEALKRNQLTQVSMKLTGLSGESFGLPGMMQPSAFIGLIETAGQSRVSSFAGFVVYTMSRAGIIYYKGDGVHKVLAPVKPGNLISPVSYIQSNCGVCKVLPAYESAAVLSALQRKGCDVQCGKEVGMTLTGKDFDFGMSLDLNADGLSANELRFGPRNISVAMYNPAIIGPNGDIAKSEEQIVSSATEVALQEQFIRGNFTQYMQPIASIAFDI